MSCKCLLNFSTIFQYKIRSLTQPKTIIYLFFQQWQLQKWAIFINMKSKAKEMKFCSRESYTWLNDIFIVKLVAKGRDVSELFPAVVKNVAAKNLEVCCIKFTFENKFDHECIFLNFSKYLSVVWVSRSFCSWRNWFSFIWWDMPKSSKI